MTTINNNSITINILINSDNSKDLITQDQVLTVTELKDYLHCGINRARALMKSPAFPSTKLGSSYIVTLSALTEWLKLNEGRNFLL